MIEITKRKVFFFLNFFKGYNAFKYSNQIYKDEFSRNTKKDNHNA